ncbi:hypothetical protein QE152_g37317 [Popillia japonica]|uniref:Uncharacterized protein n=1 Tax=Popillia japonica TaxID=7064 RepID=A0AAW1IAY9_POPJA
MFTKPIPDSETATEVSYEISRMIAKRRDSETATEVSYEISRMIAKRSRPFNDGDFVKESIVIAAKKMCPEAAKKVEKIQLNRMTIQRRIMSLSDLYLLNNKGIVEDSVIIDKAMLSPEQQCKQMRKFKVDLLNVGRCLRNSVSYKSKLKARKSDIDYEETDFLTNE